MMARGDMKVEGEGPVEYRGLRDCLDQVERVGELSRIDGADWDREPSVIAQLVAEKSKGSATG